MSQFKYISPKTKEEALLKRISLRGRDYEKTISEEYLKKNTCPMTNQQLCEWRNGANKLNCMQLVQDSDSLICRDCARLVIELRVQIPRSLQRRMHSLKLQLIIYMPMTAAAAVALKQD